MNKKTDTYKRLGDYIRQVDVRNKDLKVERLLGVNLSKEFIPSVANTIGTDMSKYKVVKKNQFGCKLMSVGRDGIMPISLYKQNTPSLISSAYYVFEVNNQEELLPDFLFMWLIRPEFDRQLAFYAGADVRGGVTWDFLCDMPIIVPSIDRQRALVAQYESLSRRIRINEQMIATLEDTAQALYRKMFVEGIDKENLPEGWRIGTLGEVAEYVSEKVDVKLLSPSDYVSAENMIKDFGGLTDCVSFPSTGKCTKYNVGDILLSNIRPYFKKMWLATRSGGCSNDVLNIRVKDVLSSSYLFYTLANDTFIDYVTAGSIWCKDAER